MLHWRSLNKIIFRKWTAISFTRVSAGYYSGKSALVMAFLLLRVKVAKNCFLKWGSNLRSSMSHTMSKIMSVICNGKVVAAWKSAKLKAKNSRRPGFNSHSGQKHPSIRKKDHSWKWYRRKNLPSKLKNNIHPSEKDYHSWKKEKFILSKTIGIHSALLKCKSIDDIID